jgi:hypothetical protein
MTVKEKRAIRRTKVLKTGMIVSMDYGSVSTCTVRDLSPLGAKVVYTGQRAVPDEFQLLLKSDWSIRDAKAIWRKDGIIGVEFTSPARRAPPRQW